MIVCCGEALIDFLPRKGADGGDTFQPFVGGSVLNVAVALGRLGAPAGFFSGLSTDFFGSLILKALHDSKVDTSLCPVSGRPTTLAFVKLTDGNAEYAFFDEGSAVRMLDENDLPAIPAAVTALHFGSISLTAEPCGSAYERLMRNESPDRFISLDPNIRPSLIKNRDGYLARLGRMVEMSDIVKLSREDMEWIAPGGTFEALAEDWLKRGASLVILTQGPDGARAMGKRRSVFVQERRGHRRRHHRRRRHVLRRGARPPQRARQARQAGGAVAVGGRPQRPPLLRRQGRGDHRLASRRRSALAQGNAVARPVSCRSSSIPARSEPVFFPNPDCSRVRTRFKSGSHS